MLGNISCKCFSSRLAPGQAQDDELYDLNQMYTLSNLQAYLTEALAAMVATLGGARLQGGPLLPALLAGVGVRLDSPDALVRHEFQGLGFSVPEMPGQPQRRRQACELGFGC